MIYINIDSKSDKYIRNIHSFPEYINDMRDIEYDSKIISKYLDAAVAGILCKNGCGTFIFKGLYDSYYLNFCTIQNHIIIDSTCNELLIKNVIL